MIDANGNISVAISGTNDPDGKIAKENPGRAGTSGSRSPSTGGKHPP